jgi:hypothetical protein
MTKVLIPVVLVFVAYAIYVISPTDEIGSFEKVRAGGEMNQSVNVYVDASKGFEKNHSGNVTAFYALDKDGDVAIISLNEPAPEEIMKAKVVELFGHMHGNNFKAISVEVVDADY